jgi:peptidoglycan/LPS O-acetylase OafA/YrhL
MDRLRGLDSLRFWLAMWVYFSHAGLPPIPLLVGDQNGLLPKVIRGGFNNLFCGVAAVIAFFVISGFCIHYPYRGSKPLLLREFYVRRYVRVLVPLGAGLVIGRFAQQDLGLLYGAILWSLVAELIYYSIYPIVRMCAGFAGWTAVVGVAFVLAFAVILTSPGTLNYHGFGPALTWALGLPCWVLGCYLAERRPSLKPAPRSSVLWLWRLSMWALSSIASVLRFHGGIGYPWSLTLLALPIFVWIGKELERYATVTPSKLWEAMGQFSYSIYLIHVLAVELTRKFLPGFDSWLGWLGQIAIMLGVSYAFYLCVERPSHTLARRLARLVR